MIRINIGFTLLLMGCGKSSGTPAAESAPSLAAQEARTTFDTVCSTCHGPRGTGDGIGAAKLDPKPRNYTDKAWQASVTDEQIKQIILGGGAAVGKSPMMPPSPQLKDKPRVIDELVKIVRSFGNGAEPPAATSSR